MTVGPSRWQTRFSSTPRGRKRRRSGRYWLFLFLFSIILIFLGFNLWELWLFLLIDIYLRWCLKT